MAIRRYLAMTAAEILASGDLPPKIAWMACHFSPYCTGLSNLPKALPAGSLLILDDFTPICGHDPEQIAAQLKQRAEALECAGILLDFQRPGNPETAALAQYLTQALPRTVAVSQPYAQGLSAPVLLPPVPHHVPLREYLAPWQGREIWLEMALGAERITLTSHGAEFADISREETKTEGFADTNLQSHYAAETSESAATFTLWRTARDLDALLEEAEANGVSTAVGLYQELGTEGF